MLRSFALLLLTICLAACNPSTAMKVPAPRDDDAMARGYVDLLRQKNYEHIEESLAPDLRKNDPRPALTKMAECIPPDEPVAIKVIGYSTFIMGDQTRTAVSLEYQFPTQWLVANLVFLKNKDGISVLGFHVALYADSQEKLNHFTFRGRGLVFYLIFALALFIPMLIVYALAFCIRTPMAKGKWLWIAFILFGLGTLGLNWTTGQCNFNLLSFQLFGAGCFAAPYGPWTISISLPAGAILFLLRRKKILAENRPESK